MLALDTLFCGKTSEITGFNFSIDEFEQVRKKGRQNNKKLSKIRVLRVKMFFIEVI
ncbi:hypothetical protein D3C87_1866540 [compost metagenome]